MAEAKNAATINRLMSKRPSVLYLPKSTLFSRVKGHKGSPVLPRLLPSIVMGSLLRRAHFESLIAAEAKNSATINQLKYRSRSCITENIALGAWSRENKALCHPAPPTFANFAVIMKCIPALRVSAVMLQCLMSTSQGYAVAISNQERR